MIVRQGRRCPTLVAASIISGPVDVLDLVLPLWAGAVLGATPAQIGILLALELLASFAFRPVAGRLADTRERTRVAALGATLYAVRCLGYAFAPGIGTAYAAALVGGTGGVLLWVSIRAITGEPRPSIRGSSPGC